MYVNEWMDGWMYNQQWLTIIIIIIIIILFGANQSTTMITYSYTTRAMSFELFNLESVSGTAKRQFTLMCCYDLMWYDLWYIYIYMYVSMHTSGLCLQTTNTITNHKPLLLIIIHALSNIANYRSWWQVNNVDDKMKVVVNWSDLFFFLSCIYCDSFYAILMHCH